jgi:hypothetical protein
MESWLVCLEVHEIYLFSETSIPPLIRLTLPPIQYGLGALSPGTNDRGVKLATNYYQASRLRTAGAIVYSPYTLSCRGQGYF